MQKHYKTLSDMAEDEFVEQRSRFIGAVSPAANAEEAAAFIQKRRKMHPDARHHVFAYTLLDGYLPLFRRRRAAGDRRRSAADRPSGK